MPMAECRSGDQSVSPAGAVNGIHTHGIGRPLISILAPIRGPQDPWTPPAAFVQSRPKKGCTTARDYIKLVV
jgi:hypothetical protein